MIRKIVLSLLVILISVTVIAQSSDSILYKRVDSTSLYLFVDYPPGFDRSQTYPALVFFFGGGWRGGTTDQFEPQARYFARRGMICIRADYRVYGRHGTSPFESLMDAKSAIRYLREHAGQLHIDPQRIVASGGSAGGHLAAATALVKDFNEASDLLSYSCVPNALVLFNPVIDNGPGGYAFDRIGEHYKAFSPLHNIRAGAPPTIFFLGTEDNLIPVETAHYYQLVMEKAGSRCDLFLYDGQGHGFFNPGRGGFYKKTVAEANRFLTSLGYLGEDPEIPIE